MEETERADETFRNLEDQKPAAILEALLAGQRRALDAVEAALPAIERAAEAAALRIGSAGRLIYCGAGTSGRIGLLDAMELGPTFDWPDERRQVVLAGGEASLMRSREGAEDETHMGREMLSAVGAGPHDVLLALAASGHTPFTLAAAGTARAAGALTIGLANNPSAPLLAACEHPILLRTGSEVLAGSTRLAAGTAQKAALNLFSTLLMIRLGKVFRGRMVDMRPTNAKLKQRAHRIVQDVVGCSPDEAARALEAARGSIREAILALEATR
ncbi:N-acetylmuramic acid 6-phosphate etherase [Aureimonas phyllosphaerae]|uniref:N-acetylmuramic acid 6-phosphate etherase n=1 Tax=Aureimonas phyllosphaerae TaxID=1166078 RepID=A0A7W6C058_9HYPH|nr:N-acetylmuramic acid 6-phosphate etherase [Aureimonas phyllosphaerae]MBB3938005.1 N-acetylmuramic acid 6-phosphate etherase [Aureimonas phyllosphaerae]MBB3962012.1 N-acetylmuramic acid 6-phosphate etherase [Aureimonas phyllosphaerae]SFF53895.1 N-acetylmuramic acid 6-phosphate etherase [Aureimonas phyllosphaerae]